MLMRTIPALIAGVAAALMAAAYPGQKAMAGDWQEEFGIEDCDLVTTGKNPYFILEPGYQLVLESDDATLHITVLDETKVVDGVVTRVIEEREWEDGELYEVARNYFAMCAATQDVFYFGEDVDFYEDGEIVDHEGTWLAGVDGAKAGLIMSGSPKIGTKYYQEIAPGVAMDRAEIVSLNETCETPAGTFSNCMKIKEGTALNFLETEYKYYVSGIGMIRDEDLKLVRHGPVDDR